MPLSFQEAGTLVFSPATYGNGEEAVGFDARPYSEIAFSCYVTDAGSAACEVAFGYSTDGGSNYTVISSVSGASTGAKDTGWIIIPEGLRGAAHAMIGWGGQNGDGAASLSVSGPVMRLRR